jgi:ParB family chromosome partitioning protein
MHHHHRKKGAITMPESAIERIDLDPTKLLVDVNIRKDSRLDKDFVASIKELGVLVPLVAVRTAAGEVRVRFGHRRTLAAIEAGLPTVPVEIVGDEATDDAGQIDRILQQHAENVHRQGLTAGEKVQVVAQLSAFGVKASEITKKTRIPKKDVRAAITVAGSDLAKAASERYDFLTLEQAAVVAEFEDDPDAVKRLVVHARDGGFDHVAQGMREDREERIVIAKAEAELAADGITVVEVPLAHPARTLIQIRRTKKTLTEDAHSSCPGHAAFVEAVFEYDDDEGDTGKWVTEVGYVCTDPVAYGHLKAAGTAVEANVPRDTSAQDAADEAEREERRRVLANNKAWRAAEAVRREWLKTFLARKAAPKGAAAFIAEELLSGRFSGHDGSPSVFEALGGDTLDASSTDSRALVVAIGVILGSYESETTERAWRNRWAITKTAPYLSQLVEWGYEPSEIEQTVIDRSSETNEADEDSGAA